MTTLRIFSLAGGELSPKLWARTDQQKYQNAARTMRNTLVMKDGGSANKPGTKFICEVKDSTKTIRFIPFVFNASQTYVLEFGHQYMRVIQNGVQLTSLSLPYEIATPYVEADLPTLQFAQSADVITITHKNYAVRELSRTGHTSWTLSTVTFGASISAPTGLTGSAGVVSNPIPVSYVVTAVAENGEESPPSTPFTDNFNAPYGEANLSWNAVSGAVSYNVYKTKRNGGANGIYGFIGVAGTGASMTDQNYEPDTTDTPPTAKNPFPSAGNYPAAVSYIQERRFFANTTNEPEKVCGSRIGQFKNFNVSNPIQDDDAVTFSMVGRQVNEVKHLLDLGKFMVLTTGGEHTIQGDSSGIIKPGEINPKQNSYNGSATLSPLIVGNTALYIQARGTIIRDLAFNFESDGYQGDDLTVYASHLFEGYTIADWAYQQIPNSIIWAVRNDGVLLGLTYVKKHEILAWHHHDFDGTVENVCVVPEGIEDTLYLCIKRTVNGTTKRYIERMATRKIQNIVDAIFMESALTYDGRNTNASHTMTLSGGTNWTYSETLTLTSSASTFTAGDVGNAVFLDGEETIRFTIQAYSSGTIVTGTAHKTVPVSMRSVALSSWSKAVDQVTGLSHLEGKNVSILGDGFVVASPNNASYVVRTVTDGTVTLDKPYAVIHVGLPYISDLETLDIDTAQGETMADKKKQVGKVILQVEKTRGVWAGPKPPTDDEDDPLENLTELKLRDDEGYDDPIELATGTVEINIQPEWSKGGRTFLRQVDPLPMSILSITPSGFFPFR